MTGKGGRDRLYRDYPSRLEEKSQPGRGSALPSRHLWVGNLSHNISEATLCDHFLRYGELENIAFQPGRCYAFINFHKEEDAVAAMKGLQGFHVAGLRLKIEFAKAEKSLLQLRDEDYMQRRDEQRSLVRGPSFSQRDSRTHHGSPENLCSDNLKMDDTNAEPSDVLWIGFPALLKVDEIILRKAFSPFGEIEKITAFPGRSYAFVQFKSVMAACRAKETLHGKLFGNPRVHICFSRSEHGKQNSGKNSVNVPQSPHFKSDGHLGSSDRFWEDRKFGDFPGDLGERSPRFSSNLGFGDSDVGTHNRKDYLWTTNNGPFEQRRHREVGLEPGLSDGSYERYSGATRDGSSHIRDFSSQKYPQNRSLYNDSWDLPEDSFLLHGSKKLKIGSFHPEKELPDYPFSDFPRPVTVEKKLDAISMRYKQPLDYPINLTTAHSERNSHWTDSLDDSQQGSGSLPPNIVDGKKFAPASFRSSNDEWKWEGVIAKGGTAICRARCFPVGKVIDVVLPDFLDCTARTSLDMLAKHYYQAAGAWVVFFVPGTDVDIGFYNEFMHYLEEKQRAAVAKLDEKTTLFLVPPSDFSQNVLKVPGKLSISGVVLKLDNSGGSCIQHADTSHLKPTSPSRSFPPITAYPNNGTKSGDNNISHSGDTGNESMQPYIFQQSNPALGQYKSHHQLMGNSMLGNRNIQSHEVNNKTEYQLPQQEAGSAQYTPTSSHYAAEVRGRLPVQEASAHNAILQPELASVLLRQQREAREPLQQTSSVNQLENSFAPSQRRVFEDDQLLFASQLGRVHQGHSEQQQQQQQTQQHQYQQLQTQQNLSVPAMPQIAERELQATSIANQQLRTTDKPEEDPQKRLQATLQLAAALLQQIQQGKPT